MLTLLIAMVLTHDSVCTPLTPIVNGRPVIVHLVSREHVISITTSPSGPLYSAKTKGGELLASGLTLRELKERQPDVYRLLHPAISADASAARD